MDGMGWYGYDFWLGLGGHSLLGIHRCGVSALHEVPKGSTPEEEPSVVAGVEGLGASITN